MSTDHEFNKLTINMSKASTRPQKVTPEPPTEDLIGTYGNPHIDELAKRLSSLETQIVAKAEKGKLVSQILLSPEAVLIQSDKIGVLGDVTFADFVRDQNGTSTGVIDPNVTRIVGDKITTGNIRSNNWNETQGSDYNLDDGDIRIGGSANPALHYDGTERILTVRGEMRIDDEVIDAVIDQHGYFATGDVTYDTETDTVTGTGILMGTPGLYFVKDDVVIAQFNISEGTWLMASESTSFTEIVEGGGTAIAAGNNAELLAYDAQRTADMALMTILDHLNP